MPEAAGGGCGVVRKLDRYADHGRMGFKAGHPAGQRGPQA
jgi:hypothetical protein